MGKKKIIILGSGVSGLIAAWQLNKLGFEVVICTKSIETKHTLQTVQASIMETFKFLGLSEVVAACFQTPTQSSISWGENSKFIKIKEKSFLFHRHDLDKCLLDALLKEGIKINICSEGFQCVKTSKKHWLVKGDEHHKAINADFIVNATGRHISRNERLTHNGLKTLALRFSCLNASKRLQNSTYVASGKNYWCWGARLGNIVNLSVFIDPKTLTDQYQGKSGRLLNIIKDKHNWINTILGNSDYDVLAMDATPYYAIKTIDANLIHIGDAVLKSDPLSSQGIQAAIASASQAAICINTLLSDIQSRQYVERFYTERIVQRANQQAQFSAASYAQVAKTQGHNFWVSRGGYVEQKKITDISKTLQFNPSLKYQFSSETIRETVPFITTNFIKTCEAINHPNLKKMITYPNKGFLARVFAQLKTHSISDYITKEGLGASQTMEFQEIILRLIQAEAIEIATKSQY